VAVLSAADIWINRYLPPLEQPFRDVATVFVALTPAPQFFGGYAILIVQSEPLNLLFERSGNIWGGLHWLSPVRISASASLCRQNEWFLHGSHDTPPSLTVITTRQLRTRAVGRAELLLHTGGPKRGLSVRALDRA
jgi:hypothetical protein